jgi:hypothetical protein
MSGGGRVERVGSIEEPLSTALRGPTAERRARAAFGAVGGRRSRGQRRDHDVVADDSA